MQNDEAVVHNVLQASTVMLTISGSFVLALEGHRCDHFVQDFNQGLCGSTHSGDLAGSVLCRNVEKSTHSNVLIEFHGYLISWFHCWILFALLS